MLKATCAFSSPYRPGGVVGLGLKVSLASAGRICAPAGGAPSRPKPSRVRQGFSALLTPSPATPRDSVTSRCSMFTNRPLSAMLLQPVLAVVWISTR